MKDRDNLLECRRLEVLRETGLLRAIVPDGLDAICERARARFGTKMALVTLVDRSRQIVKAGTTADVPAVPRSAAFCHHTIQSDEVMVVPDAKADPRFAGNPFVTGDPNVRFYAGAPLVYLPDVRLGALCLVDFEPRDFSQLQRTELASMAREAVQLIADWEFERWFS